jgi:hypothetical protein
MFPCLFHKARELNTIFVVPKILWKITNYWHLNVFLLFAPKRGWHLCNKYNHVITVNHFHCKLIILINNFLCFIFQRLTIPRSCPPCFSRLMSQCWELEPKKRPSFRDILTRLHTISHDGLSLYLIYIHYQCHFSKQ